MTIRCGIVIAFGFVAALALTSCAHLAPAPGALVIDGLPADMNLHCFVNEHGDGTGNCLAYSSRQPTPAELATMRDALHVKRVIKLNKPSLVFDGPHDPVTTGVEIWAHPWWPVGPVSHEEMQTTVDDLDDCIARARASSGQETCDVHCRWGKDRSRLLVAVYRVRHGVAPAIAWAEWRAFPRDSHDGLLYDAFERETGYHIPNDER